jgi:hypothetical protein
VLIQFPHCPLRQPVLIQQEFQRPLLRCAAHRDVSA